MKMTGDSVLKMHPLARRAENEEEMLIGRTDISNFIVLPVIGVEIIDLLDEGKTVNEVATIMEERLGEPVDVLDFANDLAASYQFVHTVDGEVVNESVAVVDHFSWIKEATGQFFFNRVAFCLYGCVFLAGVLLCAFTGKYIPVYSDIFVSTSVTVSVLASFVTIWMFLFFHELAHLLAARSLSIGSRIGLGHRLVFAVAETNMSNIVLVEPGRRYKAFVAGMAWDATFWGIGVILLFAHDAGWVSLLPFIQAFIRMVNVILLMALAFQFMVFMQTDVYYMLATRFRCANLLMNTRLFLKSKIRSLTQEEQEEWEYVSLHEKQVIRWYSWVYLIGSVWAIWFFVQYQLRMAIDFIAKIADEMRHASVASWQFWDGILLIILVLVPFFIVGWSWLRAYRQRKSERERAKSLQEA
ncbi:PqqD family protein [Brevibacillus sp. HD1.4A]|uniref:PqqD family protein n=1 Tax=Brevibacillus sp. HD1.4A TaxID=2738978 RepID=UPI00156B85FD|nr:PqqD family protein [Brevibacillus sp. HD1.4A]